MAATIVDDVAFNTRRHKRPKAASLAYWCAYFGRCPERRMRTVIKHAMDSGLLEVTQKMFNGSYTPHYRYIGTDVEINTTITDSISSSNKNLNIQNGEALALTPEAATPDRLKHDQGKSNPKTCEASPAFLKICLERKWEFTPANDNGKNSPCLIPELTPDDEQTAQRLEHEIAKAGCNPVRFMNWLTLCRFQQSAICDYSNSAHWSLLFIMAHRATFIERYRADFAKNKTSEQQLTLAAMAPAGMKLDIPLYERDLETAIGLFSWDQHWLDHQQDGQWAGRTRLEHLRKYTKYQPEMETWIDDVQVRARVLELMAPAHQDHAGWPAVR
ncbi:hypothetical protein [Paraburkholderia steynii]|nr:hypothetical protein [Paraburkholderia steynii]